MNTPSGVSRPVKRIMGGVKLNHHKNTEDFETVRMPVPQKVYIPMLQHIGVAATPCIEKGDKVFVGTLIGESQPTVCSPIHSSVSGEVEDIVTKTIGGRPVQVAVIKSDGEMTPDPELKPREVNNHEQLIAAVKASGLVGLGGAGFPTHIKLLPPEGTAIDTLIINAAECEPYLTPDYREIMENPEDVLNGINLIKKVMGIEKAVIGIEENKPLAINKMSELIGKVNGEDGAGVSVMMLPSKYPQGAEKVIIYSATGRKLPAGALPSDVGCIVMNVTSVAAIYRYIRTGMPLVEKRITVDGNAVEEPKNVFVPIGTPIKDVIKFIGEIDEEAERIIIGGPMMGAPVSDVNTVIEKRNNGLLIMRKKRKAVTTNCIRCGRCMMVCPMNIAPREVDTAITSGQTERLPELNVNYCIECGSCSYICPAKRPLTEVMRVAKQQLRGKK